MQFKNMNNFLKKKIFILQKRTITIMKNSEADDGSMYEANSAVAFSFSIGGKTFYFLWKYFAIFLLIFCPLSLIYFVVEYSKCMANVDLLLEAFNTFGPSIDDARFKVEQVSIMTKEIKKTIPAQPYSYVKELLFTKYIVIFSSVGVFIVEILKQMQK